MCVCVCVCVGTVGKCIAAGGDYFEGDQSFMCVLSIKVLIRKSLETYLIILIYKHKKINFISNTYVNFMGLLISSFNVNINLWISFNAKDILLEEVVVVVVKSNQ